VLDDHKIHHGWQAESKEIRGVVRKRKKLRT
jgi:hypothetical protein